MCEPKIDGLGVALLYERGRFVRGATRGDGRVGEDITQTCARSRPSPQRLRGPLAAAPLEVRGEVFMPREAFRRLNAALEEAGESTFANPRNAAAGAVRQKDPDGDGGAAARRLPLPREPRPKGSRFASHWETLEALRASGFPVNPRAERCADLDGVIAYCAALEAERDALDYEADGVVVKVDDLEQQRRLGATSHHPRWAIALKFAARQATTRVLEIDVNVGKTGALTPDGQARAGGAGRRHRIAT